MCDFKTAIITSTDVLHDLDHDSHEDLIQKYKLNDKTASPDFVRVEMLPKDGNIFNHARGNWSLKVDQDFRPEWFHEAEAAEAIWPIMEATFAARFLLSGEHSYITRGRWFVGGSAVVGRIGGSAIVENIGGSAVVKSIEGCAVVKTIRDSAVIKHIGESAVVENIEGSAIVEDIGGWTVIKNIWESAIVKDVRDYVGIKRVLGSAVVESIGDWATIKHLGDSAIVKNIWGTAIVESIWRSAVIESAKDSAVLAGVYSSEAKWSLKDKAIAILRYEMWTRIVTAEKAAKLEAV